MSSEHGHRESTSNLEPAEPSRASQLFAKFLDKFRGKIQASNDSRWDESESNE